jgi:hypothetical protein
LFLPFLIRQLNTVWVPHPFPRILREWVGMNVTLFLPDQERVEIAVSMEADVASSRPPCASFSLSAAQSSPGLLYRIEPSGREIIRNPFR